MHCPVTNLCVFSLDKALHPAVRKQPPTTRTVNVWSDSVYQALMDGFDTTDWEILCK